MKLAVDRLTTTPTAFEFEAGSSWWRAAIRPERDLPHELAEPLRLRVRAHRMGEDICLEGELCGGVELECGRCLARYRHPLREPLRLVLEPAGDRVPADPESAEALAREGLCLGEDLEAGWYRGSEIELGSLAREVVSLALPVKPLCREDCPGLCPVCGTELGAGRCSCRGAPVHSPFAALAALRSDGPGGGRPGATKERKRKQRGET